jgi:agmatine/peptidylarginine deiminase
MNKKYFLLFAAIILSVASIFSQQLTPEQLKAGRWLSQEEYNHRGDVGKHFQPTDAPAGPVNPVAEFGIMQGVLVAYPFGIPMELIVDMSEDVMVTTIVSGSGQAASVSNMYQNAGVNMDHVDFLIEDHDTYWTRDYGPWFIREEDKVSIINFTYNRPRPDDNIMPVNVANMLGIDYYNMPVTHTGGNYMADGFNTVAQTELVYEENSIPDSQVDQYMEDYLGVTNNFVINDPLGDYIKHIDCWGKFLATDKVLVCEVPASDPRYDDYEAAADYFASRDCAYGYPYEVVRVYAPGDYPYTPYSNSLILNKKVYLPITGSAYDDDAIAAYQQAMPGYEIVPITTDGDAWLNTDALHCRTHEIADIGMLKITHIPSYHGEVDYQSSYTIDAKVHAYSDEAVYPDSILVYYKINDGEYTPVVMSDLGDEQYSAEIQANPGDEVAYYLHAADESGRSEDCPYIGAPDPFTFTVSGSATSYLEVSPDSLYYYEGDRVLVKNIGTEDVLIDTIHGGNNYGYTYVIDHFNPEVPSYPYSLAPNDSIEIFIYFIPGCREIWWDALQIVTADSTYISMLGNDISATNELYGNSQLQLYPNPIVDGGKISFHLNEAAAVELSIYDIQGRFIQRLENSLLDSGSYEYFWDGEAQDGSVSPAGIYFVNITIDGQTITKKWLKM